MKSKFSLSEITIVKTISLLTAAMEGVAELAI